MQAWVQVLPAGCGYNIELVFILIIACIEVHLHSFVVALQVLPVLPFVALQQL